MRSNGVKDSSSGNMTIVQVEVGQPRTAGQQEGGQRGRTDTAIVAAPGHVQMGQLAAQAGQPGQGPAGHTVEHLSQVHVGPQPRVK